MNFAVVDQSGQAVRTDAAWLEAHWMPFTGNRDFKARPRMIVEASGCYFTDSEGRNVIDMLADRLSSTRVQSTIVSIVAAVLVGHAVYGAVFAPHLVTKLAGYVTSGPSEQLFPGVPNQPR